MPVIDLLEGATHERGPLAVGQAVCDAKCLDPLLVSQHSDGSGPVGAPHTAIEAKRVEDVAERVPDVVVRERLVRECAGSADFDCDIVMGRQGE